MLGLVETLLILGLISLLFALYSHYSYWQRHGVPQQTPLPFLGNMKGVGTEKHFCEIVQEIYGKFKNKSPIGGLYVFIRKSAVILDLEVIKHVLIKDFSNFHDRGVFNNVRDDPLTGHLVTLEGEQWRAMRNKLSPVFTSARMKYMFPTVARVAENLVEVVHEMLRSGNSAEILEMKELCARFTTDVIGTCAFGIDCCSLKNPKAEFRQRGRAIFSERRYHPLIQQFMFSNPKLARRLRMKFFPDHITKFFLNVIKETVEYRQENGVKRNDFLDLLIELKAKNEELARGSLGIDLSKGLTLEQMAAQTFVFFVAGFETSSTTMTFCLYELARHMQVQERLRQEILESLKKTNGEITYEGLHELQYLDQVVAETLRLYPVIPTLLRTTTSNYRIPNSDCIVEEGTQIAIPVYSIHRDPAYYDQPNEFNPDNFEPKRCEERHSCAYLPFGDGPRNCIGLRFGKMQTKLGLVALLRKFRFEICPQTELVMDKKNFLLTTESGVDLKVTIL
ncbi:probable cytochrome P450 6a14 [Musca domestica]|uniref:Probable cytochrome P450 6a14 n=1 Tax=Musca domestica TaxID=7370 RepID=A0A1I8MI61_MUSDO|nr:probable cytochrome P450 6a14 [Musca domestica]